MLACEVDEDTQNCTISKLIYFLSYHMSYQIILSCAQHYKKNPVALGCLFDDSIYIKIPK